MATTKVLLLEDVGAKGRKGDIVDLKSGFARNFVVPQGKGVRATKHAIRMQERLKEERLKQAAVDRADSEKLAAKYEGKVYETSVKVDSDGHMYGSVSAIDVKRMLAEDGLELDRRNVSLHNPIKKLGVAEVTLRLKEGVECNIKVKVMGEGIVDAAEQEALALMEGEEAPVEEASEEASAAE